MRGIRALREHEVVQAPGEHVHAPIPPVPPRRKRLVQQPGLANGQFAEGEGSEESESRSSTHHSVGEERTDGTSCGSAEDDDLDFEVRRIVSKGIEEDRGYVATTEKFGVVGSRQCASGSPCCPSRHHSRSHPRPPQHLTGSV